MWTAACLQGILQCFDQIACVHMSGLFGDGMATDDPPHGGITAQKVGVPIFIIVTRPTPTPVETSTSVSGGMAGIMAKALTHFLTEAST
jgi:hypothetical protein